jgi:hypothetical protein
MEGRRRFALSLQSGFGAIFISSGVSHEQGESVTASIPRHHPRHRAGRAVPGLRCGAPVFPGERGRFRRLTKEGSGRFSLAGHVDRPSSARFSGFGAGIITSYTHYPPVYGDAVYCYMQADYDLWQAMQQPAPKVVRAKAVAS